MLKPFSSLSLSPTTLFSSTIALSHPPRSVSGAPSGERETARGHCCTNWEHYAKFYLLVSNKPYTQSLTPLSLSVYVFGGEKVKDLLMVCVRVKCVSAWYKKRRACFLCVLCLTTSEYYCNYLIQSDNVPVIVLLLSNTFANTCMCFSITCQFYFAHSEQCHKVYVSYF